MAVLLSASLARSHQYKQAAELLQSLVQQLEALQTDSTYAASLKKSAAYCQSLAPIENICQQLTPLTEAQQIPMIKDTIKFTKDLINIHGQINGKSSPMLFDTGASINIISSSDADKYGLRKLGSSYTVIGIGTASGQVARGCLKIKNRDRLTYNL